MHTIDTGDTAWMLMSAALVLMMTAPGLAIFYGGMVRKKNIISTLYYSFVSAIVVSVLWVAVQYTLAFGVDHHGVIGGLNRLFWKGVGINTCWGSLHIPENVFSMFQMMFAIITVALISGAIVERMRFRAWIVFLIAWSLLVYAPLAHWVWGGGWLGNGSMIGKWFGHTQLHVLDFAGGLVVEIASGVSALVAALYVGKRVRYGKEAMGPNNIVLTAIGAGLLWFGWFGFNAGSAGGANGLAGNAFAVTNTAGAMAALVWMLLEVWHNGKPSLIGASTGLVAGLVAATPAAGFVDIQGALIIGAVVSLLSYYCIVVVKKALGYDDSLDVFGVHGVGGIVGIIGTGLLANPAIGTYSNGQPAAGLFYGNPMQLSIQLVGMVATILLCAVGTLVILWGIERVMPLRVEPQEEIYGLDIVEHGEALSDR